MRNDETHGGRRGQGRWEPAHDSESRRWHGPHKYFHEEHHLDDDDEVRGPRVRGRRRFGGPGMGVPPVPPFAGDPLHAGLWLHKAARTRARRARRGDVRAAALALIAEEPRNGYQIIQEISERSGGIWQPSPGSVYPALQQLEDEGLITAEAGDGGRRAYRLTEEGRGYADSHASELRAPWEMLDGPGESVLEMRLLVGQVAVAAFQVLSAGTQAQAGQARQLLTDTRKALYRILAAEDAGDGGAAQQ